jgi:methyl-accepting chemotaxis protein
MDRNATNNFFDALSRKAERKLTMKILRPAYALMQRLRYGSKFGLIGFIAIIPLAVLMYFFIAEVTEGSSFAEGERVGLRVLRPGYDILSGLAHLRSALTDKSDATKFKDGIKSDIAAIDAACAGDGKFMKLDSDWSTAKSALTPLLDGTPKAADVDAASDKVCTFLGTLGNNSQLVLDPAIDSYYAQDTITVQIEVAIQRRPRRAIWLPR